MVQNNYGTVRIFLKERFNSSLKKNAFHVLIVDIVHIIKNHPISTEAFLIIG